MQTEVIFSSERDARAVEAVRRGDVEKYRELVERHERRVYAVAWSRLGDAGLAEEANQEAFIRAYRRLWLLGEGAKFSAWIASIARHVAINFGLRHRRELNKRERWALEQGMSTEAQSPAEETDAPCTPEMLRQTLAELPAAHRECLVLFYLEGKSGADAATALGITEAALRVRLHRARTALRERLEERLADSLGKLVPAKTLVPAIMAVILTSSTAKGAVVGGAAGLGAGAKLLTSVGKFLPFAVLLPILQLVGSLPGLLFASWIGRMERRNYRETGGFRVRMHRNYYRSFLWGFPLLVVLVALLNRSTHAAWGIKGSQLVAVGLLLVLTLISARSLAICRNPYQVGMFFYCVIIMVGISALALGWIPRNLAQLPILVATMLFFLIFKNRPTRMDYSLFLRAAQRLLKMSGEADDSSHANRFDRRALLAFARFLGARFLVSNFRREASGLVLRLPPVGNRFLANIADVFMPPISRNCSHIALSWNGTVTAHCGKTDAANLATLNAGELPDLRELENLVSVGIGQAWREFRAGNSTAAERALGELPESEVFVVPPARAKATHWWQFFMGAVILLMLVALSAQFWHPVWLSGLKPVAVTEEQVRQFLSLVNTNPNPMIKQTIDKREVMTRMAFEWDPGVPLFTCLVLPETNLFTPRGLGVMRDAVAGSGGFDFMKRQDWRAQWIFNAPLMRRAVADGWISWSDLGIQPTDAAALLRTNEFQIYSPDKWDYLLTRCTAWSWVKSERFNVLRIQSAGVTQLRLLRAVNCLDLTDCQKLISQIASVQVLSDQPPDQPPIHDWKDVRGLFFTLCHPALQDTYFSLAALEILDGLDKIDREACINGILKRHQGKGYFTSPNSGGFNEYHIDGSARDTIAAFESLRILAALDRVKDSEKWQFRPQRRGVAKGQLTWHDVEAWVCQQRLARVLSERKANPNAPVRSLLEP